MTGLDLFTSALRLIGAAASSEPPEDAEISDCKDAANLMLDSWNTDGLNVFTKRIDSYPLAGGKNSYTLGPGGDWDAPRPQRITKANLIKTDVVPYLRIPVEVLDDLQWGAIKLQGVDSSIVLKIYSDGAYPVSTVWTWPQPTMSYLLELYTWQLLAQFDDLTADLSFPPGYARAIKYNLACEIAPEFGKEPSPRVAQIAIESKAALQSFNADPPPQMPCDGGVLTGRNRSGFNYLTGE